MKRRSDRAGSRLRPWGKVVFAGFVSKEALDHLMSRADIFVYPSIYEGFGIPVVEAGQADRPLVASNATAIPQVADDGVPPGRAGRRKSDSRRYAPAAE